MQASLLDIARSLYAEKGAKLLISEIAEAAGVSRPTVYKHLGGKAAILARLAPTQNGAPKTMDIDTRIMRGVLSVVAARGFKAAAIDAIADVSGVGAATIYRRFTNKDGLIKAFIAHHTPRDRLPDFPTGASEKFEDQLAFIVSYMLRFMVENKLLVRLIFSGSEEDRAYLGALRDQSNSTFSRLDAFFARHQAKGTIRADITTRDLTINLFGLMHAQAVIFPTGIARDPAGVERSICQLFQSIRNDR